MVVNNPSPVPLGGVAVFTCSATAEAIFWTSTAVNATQLMGTSGVGIRPRSLLLQVLAIAENNNTNATCKTADQRKKTVQLLIYG